MEERNKKIQEVKKMLQEQKIEADQKLTPENLPNLTYSEIVEYNRKNKIGTFMDKEWQVHMDKYQNPLENQSLTKKEKLINGYYSFPNLSRMVTKRIKTAQQDFEFLQQFLKSKDNKFLTLEDQDQEDLTDDKQIEDRLIFKKIVSKANFYVYSYTLLFYSSSILLFLRTTFSNTMKLHAKIVFAPFIFFIGGLLSTNSTSIALILNARRIMKPLKEKPDSDLGKQYAEHVESKKDIYYE
ncbi:unnamed protein product [Moneuplotes crassus]|uniref:Transmembrane protein n=1 Tax=Euplotes crassus TaxID=5936 RepID=A0AAD1XTM1_EUPCR|nr:unnamed protein product [Moneuplotes crassus]